MKEISQRWLNYQEELTLAVYFSNVEKFKCLSRSPLFKEECFTQPMKIYGNAASLATILACYKILYAIPGHKELSRRNNQIAEIVSKRFGLSISENVDLTAFNPQGMGNILDNKDYDNMLSWTLNCREGGYGPGEESWDRLKSFCQYVTNKALREQHLAKLGESLSEEQKAASLQRVQNEKDARIAAYRESLNRHLPESIKSFIDAQDKEGAILAIFDEGKAYNYSNGIYSLIAQYVLKNTRFITIRVGGYSYRAESGLLSLSKDFDNAPQRIESLYCDPFDPQVEHKDAKACFFKMREYKFDKDSPFVKYAEEYDYKSFSMNGESHPMVYYFVNKIDTGWYNEDGEFMSFYSNDRGLQALSDVVMVRGYNDIRPATAAIYSDTGSGKGDFLFAGGTSHFDRKTRTESQKQLFEDARIPYMNIAAIDRY